MNKVASLQPVEALGIGADRKSSQLVTGLSCGVESAILVNDVQKKGRL
jgi:electron transfer flavoprotein alpha/beta subunit